MSMNTLNSSTAGSCRRWAGENSFRSSTFCKATNSRLSKKVAVPRLSAKMAPRAYGRLVMGVVPRFELVTRAMPRAMTKDAKQKPV